MYFAMVQMESIIILCLKVLKVLRNKYCLFDLSLKNYRKYQKVIGKIFFQVFPGFLGFFLNFQVFPGFPGFPGDT